MVKSWVIMTALPFTKGHEDIIRFAAHLGSANVIFSPAVGEPLITQRRLAIDDFCWELGQGVQLHYHLNGFSEDPNEEGFWDYWRGVYQEFGFEEGDYVVGGDDYVLKLASELGGTPIYIPRGNETLDAKATDIRRAPTELFGAMSKHMQLQLQKKIVLFGAESVGKTTTASHLANGVGGSFIPEFARPYLEQNGAELSTDKFWDIIYGQVAQEQVIRHHEGVPVVYKDTDLYSTIGYLRLHPEFGTDTMLANLLVYAKRYTADKYYILSTERVPFEEDQLRYGGSVRESDDQFWIDICEEFGLSYEVITETSLWNTIKHIERYACADLDALHQYERPFND